MKRDTEYHSSHCLCIKRVFHSLFSNIKYIMLITTIPSHSLATLLYLCTFLSSKYVLRTQFYHSSETPNTSVIFSLTHSLKFPITHNLYPLSTLSKTLSKLSPIPSPSSSSLSEIPTLPYKNTHLNSRKLELNPQYYRADSTKSTVLCRAFHVLELFV